MRCITPKSEPNISRHSKYPTSFGTALALGIIGGALGLAGFMCITTLNSYGQIGQVFSALVLVPFITVWVWLTWATGWRARIAGGLFVLAFIAAQGHVQLFGQRNDLLNLVALLSILLAIWALLRPWLAPMQGMFRKAIFVSLSLGMIGTSGAIWGGQMQAASLMSAGLGLILGLYWVGFAPQPAVLNHKARLFAFIAAAALPFVIASFVRVGHGLAGPLILLQLAGSTALWYELLGAQQQQDNPRQK